MLLSAGTEGDGLHVIFSPPSYQYPQTLLHISSLPEHPRATTLHTTHSPFLRPFVAYIHFLLFFCGTFPSLCLFLATSFSLIHPGGLSGCQQERRAPQRTPPPSFNRLRTKATKHACVNISVAPAPRPGSRCSLSAGPRCEPLCGPWQTVLCCVLPDMAGLLWGGSSACMHAVAEERIRV